MWPILPETCDCSNSYLNELIYQAESFYYKIAHNFPEGISTPGVTRNFVSLFVNLISQISTFSFLKRPVNCLRLMGILILKVFSCRVFFLK